MESAAQSIRLHKILRKGPISGFVSRTRRNAGKQMYRPGWHLIAAISNSYCIT